MDKPSDPETVFTDEPCLESKALPRPSVRTSMRSVGQPTFASDRDGETPLAVPAPTRSGAAARPARAAALHTLSEAVRAIERRSRGGEVPASDWPASDWQNAQHPWQLGVADIDCRLGPHGLDTAALHEIKPALVWPGAAAGGPSDHCDPPDHCGPDDWSGAFTAALSFALSLSLCRPASSVDGAAQDAGARRSRPSSILWCWPSALAQELGGLYAPGLAALGLDPARLLVAMPDRSTDVLWAMEEGLRCTDLALVVGVLAEVQLTPARRLSLAAAAHGVSCLLVTYPSTPPAAATATRWRIGRAPSAPHPLAASLVETLPGAPRYRVLLELRRGGRSGTHLDPRLGPMTSPSVLEWSHASHRFRLAAAPANRAAEADRSRRHPRGEAAGAGGGG